MSSIELYRKYCRVDDAVFELISSIKDLEETNLDMTNASLGRLSRSLSDIEDTVCKKLKEIEDAEE